MKNQLKIRDFHRRPPYFSRTAGLRGDKARMGFLIKRRKDGIAREAAKGRWDADKATGGV
jgi:hypothetical protein